MSEHTIGHVPYINRIRNLQKRDYARRYWAFLLNESLAEPDYRPLSFMAAQAVRINLRHIYEETSK